jgi:LPS-assembly protein
MGDGGRARTGTVRSSLCAGAALAFLFGSAALAQTVNELPVHVPGQPTPALPLDVRKPPPPAPTLSQTDDGLGDQGFYLEADTLTRDDKANQWIASGKVEGRYQGRTLRADKLIYDGATGIVTADGNAQIINADGSAEFAQHLVLDNKMRAGFARVFSAQIPINQRLTARFAADVAIRRSQTVEELDRAIFTPCQICAANGSAVTPTWSIEADRIIEDHARHLVYYRNATIRIKGLPVLYTPFFSHPDPDAPRASGLLIPQISATGKRGPSYQQPILWIISPSQDLTFSPQINTKVNPFLNLSWRDRFYSGELNARIGYTYEQDFNGNGTKFGPLTSRSYILANGDFNLTPHWSWGFTADRTSDPLIFDKYDIPSAYADHGLFLSDSQRLLSQLYATRQDDDSYLSIAALDFQGLRTTDNNRTFPTVAPLIEGRYDVPFNVLGGHLRLIGNGVLLNFDESPLVPTLSGYEDRASGEADWIRTFTTSGGLRIEPFAQGRVDVYDISNLTTAARTQSVTQVLGTAGVTVSLPLIRQVGSTTIVLDPIAQLALSPDYKVNPAIPNMDDVVFSYDETNLFSPEKFNGYDLYEGGQRLNVGEQATFQWGNGLNASLLVGRTFRAETTDVFPSKTGLNGTASDWVLAADTTPIDGLSMFGRALISDQLGVERLEVGVNFATSRMNGYVRYLDDNTQITGPVRNFEMGSEILVTQHWGFDFDAIRDIEVNKWTLIDLGLVYKDDCIKVAVIYRRQNTVVGALGASDAVFLRLTLATLGDQGYNNGEVR